MGGGRCKLVLAILTAVLTAPFGPTYSQERDNDPNVVEKPRDLREDPEFVSPPRLGSPIFACGTSAVVKSFVSHAKLLIFDLADLTNPIGVGEGLQQPRSANRCPRPVGRAEAAGDSDQAERSEKRPFQCRRG